MAAVRWQGCNGNWTWGAAMLCCVMAVPLEAAAAKPTAGFTISLGFKECTPKPSSETTLLLTFSSVLPMDKVRIRFEQAGDPASKQPDPLQLHRQELDSIKPGKSYTATAKVTLPKDGRIEYRGWVESLNGDGNVVAGQSTSLYVVVTSAKVLSGRGSFETVELVELKRQRDVEEITEAEFEQRSKALTGRKAVPPSQTVSTGVTGDAVNTNVESP